MDDEAFPVLCVLPPKPPCQDADWPGFIAGVVCILAFGALMLGIGYLGALQQAHLAECAAHPDLQSCASLSAPKDDSAWRWQECPYCDPGAPKTRRRPRLQELALEPALD
jgi:hypothetical protein